ncbi:MAG: sugar phosphate isomerase/epimerase [Treponema sp.]|jgi:sugar phosphate isomerase/epimerase|nr:sugar phosphate isomerase/epimerase [Treponema sp.]
MKQPIVKQHQISIILFTVASSPLPYAEKLKKLREIGYQSVQGGLNPDLSKEQHKALLDELGIEFSCFSGQLNALKENPGKFIEACHFFNCDEIMIGTMPTEYRAGYDGYMKAIELINSVGRELAKEDIYIAYHNHAQEFRRFSNGKRGMDLLFENFDPTGVHFLLDTHWVHAGGADILAWMEKCRGRIQYLHVKDYRIGPANYENEIGDVDKQFAQIGDGSLPWELIIKKGLELGIKAFIVEQDRCYDTDPFDCAAQSFATLKSLGLS